MSSRRPSDLWFSAMLRWERLANVCPELKKQMERDLLSVEQQLAELSSIQKHGAVALLGAAYQAFGFNILGPLGRQMLGLHLVSRCGIPADVSAQWLEAVAFSLLEDLNVLQVVCGEPDWKLVDQSLATDVWQRVFCSDEQEGDLLGLDVFDAEGMATLRQHAAQALRSIRKGEVPGANAMIAGPGPGASQWPHVMLDTFSRVAQSAAANPLCLLLWRIQGVSQIQETRHEVKFIVRSPDAMGTDDGRPSGLAGALAWLLISLSPCQTSSVLSQDLESPLPWSMLKLRLEADAARGHFGEVGFDLPQLEADHGMQVKQDSPQVRCLSDVVTTARSLGLVFEIYPRPGKPAYGLTSAGLRILAPFEGLLQEWLGGLPTETRVPEPTYRTEEHKVVGKPSKVAKGSRTNEEALGRRRAKASKTSALLRKVG